MNSNICLSLLSVCACACVCLCNVHTCVCVRECGPWRGRRPTCTWRRRGGAAPTASCPRPAPGQPCVCGCVSEGFLDTRVHRDSPTPSVEQTVCVGVSVCRYVCLSMCLCVCVWLCACAWVCVRVYVSVRLCLCDVSVRLCLCDVRMLFSIFFAHFHRQRTHRRIVLGVQVIPHT